MKHPSTIRDDLPNASGRTPASVSSLDERELQDYLVSRLAASDRRVLYICFGNTDLAAKIEACTGAEVTVVDGYSRSGSQIPSSRDRAIKCDIDSIDLGFPTASFDIAICDALTKARNPARLLGRIRSWIAPDGELWLTIPNVRHWAAIARLLGGTWCETAGHDRRHRNLRFLTLREVEKLLYRTDWTMHHRCAVADEEYRKWIHDGSPCAVSIGGIQMDSVSAEDAEQFYSKAYLIGARPARRPHYAPTSIVILTRNQLGITRTCLESIRFRTDEPYQLIVVDNGSTDGTVEYLKACSDVTLVQNSDNRGFPAGCNQGMRMASGEHLLLLNNDVVVTTGWLGRLLRALYRDDAIGLVGPSSNCVSGPQQVPVTYPHLGAMDGFAWEWGKIHDGECEDVDRLVGFCLLIRRGLADKIGFLDERFGLGNFEDDDYCRRALKAGYRAVIARDAFVHHFGGVTHRAERIDHQELLARNRRLYREKWQDTPPDSSPHAPATSAKPPRQWAIRRAANPGLLLEQSPIRLSLCMIVRDNAATIEPCLRSVRPWVDEMVVVDTGSRDNTPDLVRRSGAILHHFPWCDDFAAARNESLRHARGEWVFWMDSDDTIDEACGRGVRRLALGEHAPDVLGYVMQVHCPGPGDDGTVDVTVVDHVKLLRNREDLRFEGRIHEQILPAIRRAGGEVAFTNLFVVHSGADHGPEARGRKLTRDFRLLHLELCDHPEHPFVLFNLGMTHADAGEHELAVKYLRRSIAVASSSESHVRKAYALLVASLCQQDRFDDAWAACREGLGLYPDDLELRFREASLHHRLGRLSEAELAYLQVLHGDSTRRFDSVDRGIAGFKARHNLALVYEDMQNYSEAERQWRQVVAEAPDYQAGWRGLGDVLLKQSKLDAADEAAEGLLNDGTLRQCLRVEGLVLRGRVAWERADHATASHALREAVAESPDDLNARHVLCRYLFEHGALGEAKDALLELASRSPQDGSVRHNLGTVYLRMGEHESAAEAFQQSLQCRPESPLTCVQLGKALHAAGRRTEANAAWQAALRLDPHCQEAIDCLQRASL